jgi:hypothetical protein
MRRLPVVNAVGAVAARMNGSKVYWAEQGDNSICLNFALEY